MKVVLFLSLMVFISSCSSTHHLNYCIAIKEKAEGENAFIKLKSGEEIEGKIIEIGVDSTFNENLLFKENIIIPASEVTEIHLKDRWGGAWEGAGFGLLLGLGITGIAVLTEENSRDAALTGIIIGPLITVGTSILGMLPGAIIGHRDGYVFIASLPNEYVKVKLSEIPEKIPSEEFPSIETPTKKPQRKEFVPIEVTSILKETEELK